MALPADTPKRPVWAMFDRIAHRYDLLNRLLSFGRDIAWRKEIARNLPSGNALRVLDLATGTADVLLELGRQSGRIALGVGVDPSSGMLAFGKKKLAESGVSGILVLVRGDAARLGFQSEVFDAVTIAFGIRNVDDPVVGLREICRVLKPGGRALVLEFSLPESRIFRAIYLFYFRHVLPRIGGLISGDAAAYRYLNKTVEAFPHGEAFCRWMHEAGFEVVKAHPLTLGIATLYLGGKAGK